MINELRITLIQTNNANRASNHTLNTIIIFRILRYALITLLVLNQLNLIY